MTATSRCLVEDGGCLGEDGALRQRKKIKEKVDRLEKQKRENGESPHRQRVNKSIKAPKRYTHAFTLYASMSHPRRSLATHLVHHDMTCFPFFPFYFSAPPFLLHQFSYCLSSQSRERPRSASHTHTHSIS